MWTRIRLHAESASLHHSPQPLRPQPSLRWFPLLLSRPGRRVLEATTMGLSTKVPAIRGELPCASRPCAATASRRGHNNQSIISWLKYDPVLVRYYWRLRVHPHYDKLLKRMCANRHLSGLIYINPPGPCLQPVHSTVPAPTQPSAPTTDSSVCAAYNAAADSRVRSVL